MDIYQIVSLDNKFEQFITTYNNDIPVVLYGSGGGAKAVIKFLKMQKINPVAICDGNKSKYGNKLLDIPIMSLDDIIDKYNMNFNIIISSPTFAREILNYLVKKIPKNRIHLFDCEIGSLRNMNISEYRQYILDNRAEFEYLNNKLSDTKSKVTLENVLKGWISYNPEYYKLIYSANQYFPEDIIKLNHNEVLIDAGAFVGDTIVKFIKETNNQYKKIYAFEPDKECFSKLRDKVSLFNTNNIEIINKGLYKKNACVFFRESNDENAAGTSLITCEDNATCKVDVVTIDSIIKEKITFIKMDIEGAEMEALYGAEKTIKKYKPKLAISVYHNNEDIINISQYIMGLGLDYKYYLRHHFNCIGLDTVFYAI